MHSVDDAAGMLKCKTHTASDFHHFFRSNCSFLFVIFLPPAENDEPAWMLEASRREKRRSALERRRLLEERLARVRAEEAREKEAFENRNSVQAKRRVS